MPGTTRVCMCACARVWVLGYRGTGNPDAFISVTETGLKELGICHHFVFRMWHRAFLGFLFSCILANIVQNGLSSFQGVRQRQRSLPCFFVFVLNHPSVTKKTMLLTSAFELNGLKWSVFYDASDRCQVFHYTELHLYGSRNLEIFVRVK